MRSFTLAVISADIALFAAPAMFARAQTATIRIAGTSTGKTIKAFGCDSHNEPASLRYRRSCTCEMTSRTSDQGQREGFEFLNR